MHTEIQCDRHIGSAFPPRCSACETLSAEYMQLGLLDVTPTTWVGHRPRAGSTRSEGGTC